jgi:UDP-N-acetylglucosamine diphosphorylase/glucosamine-1-phosphate N-acetyltransferase
MNYALFEDAQSVRLNPLVRLMPVFDLRCGIVTIRRKFELLIGSEPVALFTRPQLASLVEATNPDVVVNQLPETPTLVLNGRWLATRSQLDRLDGFRPGTLLMYDGVVLAACIDDSHGEQFMPTADGWEFYPDETWDFVEAEEEVSLVNYSWDLFRMNGAQIEADVVLMGLQHGQTDFAGVHLINREGVFVAPGALVMPGVVMDASSGPICLAEGARVMPNSFLEGPLSIGEKSVIKAGARIYGNTTIGPVCKVGGEVEGSVFHSFSNKQHEGFLGHSVIGRWVNLGADTNNSDLKNNYGMVRSYANGHPVDTGLQFVGLTMADHSKTGINSMFNTGTVAGILCNLFGAGFPPANIPDFSWGGAEGFEVYRADKGIEVARKVMARRGVTMLAEEEQLILRLYNELVG